MPQLIALGTAGRLWLESFHPLAPWVALAVVFWAFDKLLDATGSTAALERAVPWGKAAARAIDTLPFIVLGAAWPAVSSGDLAVGSAVYGALAAALRPVFLAVKDWLSEHFGRKFPPGGGSAVGLALACALVLIPAPGCSPQSAKSASHLASNAAAESLSWLDARLAAQYDVASSAELERLRAAGGTAEDWERWRLESGWAAVVQSVALAYAAHALLVAHLDGTKSSSAEQLRAALDLVTKAVQLGLTKLEQEKVPVPPYVREAANQLPALGALL